MRDSDHEPDPSPPGPRGIDPGPSRRQQPASGLPISPDFVDRTLERVLADRRQIEAEAQRADEVVWPRGLLAAYRVPEVGGDFVDRTADLVAADRAGNWRRTLGSFRVPPISPDFVERTLLALRVDRSHLRVVRKPAPVAADSASVAEADDQRRALRRTAAAAAAALLLAAGVWFVLSPRPVGPAAGGGLRRIAAQPPMPAQEFSPAAWGTEFARLDDERREVLRFEPVDDLVLLAREVAAGEAE